MILTLINIRRQTRQIMQAIAMNSENRRRLALHIIQMLFSPT